MDYQALRVPNPGLGYLYILICVIKYRIYIRANHSFRTVFENDLKVIIKISFYQNTKSLKGIVPV